MERKRKKEVFFIFLVACLMLRASCRAQKKYCTIFLPDGTSISAELAVTPGEKQRGLMFRETINWDQAMLFVFEKEGKQAFWMKNVRFPIDILWLDRNKRIVHIEKNVPPCRKDPCPTYSPSLEALYVLELKAGSVKRHNLKLFDKVDFILPRLKQHF